MISKIHENIIDNAISDIIQEKESIISKQLDIIKQLRTTIDNLRANVTRIETTYVKKIRDMHYNHMSSLGNPLSTDSKSKRKRNC